ncbi:MAG TPA: M20 family metallopeptidase [Thermomicrobiaceae bacterium]|nr:M20 family metallopeptidase [Thermomicrobiaceae bacterium]
MVYLSFEGGLEESMVVNQELADWVEERRERFISISDQIWAHPQVALAEQFACDLQARELEQDGFRITRNVGDMPTAFVAEWGSGKPVVGFLGEYDALPGLSQEAEPAKHPVNAGGPGHGCGHNLLGTASLAAASAVKAWLEATGKPGTVRYYGCPAEETGAGKVFMARAGVFDDLDAAITWHPGGQNTVWLGSSLAIDHLTFRFHGKTAHAAGAPHLGRSALDAVELMNIGVNFMREHMIEKARIHYVITNGGGAPNVVPDEAEVWYFVRAPERDQVDELSARVRTIAKAAAMMTETELEERDIYGIHNYLPNKALTDVAYHILQELGTIEFTDDERSFAQTIIDGYPAGPRQATLRALELPDDAKDKPLLGEVFPARDEGKTMSGSTDVSEVSWIAPTVQVTTTCWALGIPGHSWGITATGGMSIGHKGMLHAAKTMGLTASEIYSDPELLAKAKAEHQELMKNREYKVAVPEGMKPPEPRGE